MAKIQIPGDFVIEEPEGNIRTALKQAGATEGEKTVLVPPESIHIVPGLNPRFWGSPKSKAHIEGIAKSILARAEQGLPGFMPERALVCFTRRIDGADRLVLKAGQHRLAAVELANKKQPGVVPAVPVFVDKTPMTDAQLALYFATENDAEPLAPYELAVCVKRAADAGASKKEIMAELNITDRYMLDLGLLYNADPRVIELVAQGKITGTLVIEEIKAHGDAKATRRLLKGVETAEAAGKPRATKKHLPKAPTKPPKASSAPEHTGEPGDEPAFQQVAFFDATLNALEALEAFHDQFGETDERHTKMMLEVIGVNGGDDLVNYAVAAERYETTGLVRLGLVVISDPEVDAPQETPAVEAQKEQSKRRSRKKATEPAVAPEVDAPQETPQDAGALESPTGTAEGL